MDNPGNLVMGVSVGFVLWNFYKTIFKQQPHEESNRQQQPAKKSVIQEEANIFKNRLSQKMSKVKLSDPPTLEQCKQLTYLIFSYSLTNIMLMNMQMKRKRILLKRQSLLGWSEYLKTLVQGVQQTKLIQAQSKKEAYQFLKTDGQIFKDFKKQLHTFKQTLRIQGLTYIPFIPTISLQQIREILNRQIEYCQQNGEKLVENITEGIKNWSEQSQKQKISTFLSIIIIDEALPQNFQQIDEIEIQYAKKNYSEKLSAEISKQATLQKKILRELERRIRNIL